MNIGNRTKGATVMERIYLSIYSPDIQGNVIYISDDELREYINIHYGESDIFCVPLFGISIKLNAF